MNHNFVFWPLVIVKSDGLLTLSVLSGKADFDKLTWDETVWITRTQYLISETSSHDSIVKLFNLAIKLHATKQNCNLLCQDHEAV